MSYWGSWSHSVPRAAGSVQCQSTNWLGEVASRRLARSYKCEGFDFLPPSEKKSQITFGEYGNSPPGSMLGGLGIAAGCGGSGARCIPLLGRGRGSARPRRPGWRRLHPPPPLPRRRLRSTAGRVGCRRGASTQRATFPSPLTGELLERRPERHRRLRDQPRATATFPLTDVLLERRPGAAARLLAHSLGPI